jgi:hypothetical protein
VAVCRDIPSDPVPLFAREGFFVLHRGSSGLAFATAAVRLMAQPLKQTQIWIRRSFTELNCVWWDVAGGRTGLQDEERPRAGQGRLNQKAIRQIGGSFRQMRRVQTLADPIEMSTANTLSSRN